MTIELFGKVINTYLAFLFYLQVNYIIKFWLTVSVSWSHNRRHHKIRENNLSLKYMMISLRTRPPDRQVSKIIVAAHMKAATGE